MGRYAMMIQRTRFLIGVFLLVFSLVVSPVVAWAQQPGEQVDEFVPISELPPEDQLPAAPLLVSAYACVVLLLGGYVWSVGRRLSGVQQEMKRLELEIKQDIHN